MSMSSFQLETWVVSPYKKPEKEIPENEEFNNHLSMVHIRSEHAIGFLKGPFHSLKHLRLWISNEHSHKFATYWIAACIGIHAFVMQCEDEEREDADSDFEDPFIAEGLSSSSDSEVAPQPPRGNVSQRRLHSLKPSVRNLSELFFVLRRRGDMIGRWKRRIFRTLCDISGTCTNKLCIFFELCK